MQIKISPLSVNELQDYFEDQIDFVLLDVREKSEFEKAHIANSVLVPLSEIASRGKLALPKSISPAALIVVFCHHGGRSAQITEWLGLNGFKNAKNLIGGIDLWSIKVDPSIPRY